MPRHFIRARESLKALKLEDGDEELGVEIIRRAIEEPLRRSCRTRWLEFNLVGEGADDAFGYIRADGHLRASVQVDVIDPTTVSRTALQNAASIPGLLLTTEAIVPEKNEEMPAPVARGGGGRTGGMR